MAETVTRTFARRLAPLHAILLGGSIPLFLGVLFSDLAYSSTYEIQWKNFASWLLVGALVLCGFSLLWTLVELARADRRDTRLILIPALLLATWILGFVDALVHAKDAWASMPTALALSVAVAGLAIVASWLGLAPADGSSR